MVINTSVQMLEYLYLTLLKVLFAPIGLRKCFRPMFAGPPNLTQVYEAKCLGVASRNRGCN